MKNKLINLNDHLFAQIERLSDEDLSSDEIQKEVTRSTALVNVSDQIIKNADLHLKAAKLSMDTGQPWIKSMAPMLEGKKNEG